MKESLEDKIAGVFLKNDDQVRFENKEKVWKQIEAAKHGFVIVPFFWKIAAVILALMLFGSIWASYSVWNNSRKFTLHLTQKNEKLQFTIDSLLNLPIPVKTEIQYVEREKVVYRDRFIKEKTATRDEEIVSLKSQVEQLEGKIELFQVMLLQKEDSFKNAMLNASKILSADINTEQFEEPAFLIKPAMAPEKSQIEFPVQSGGMQLKILHQPDVNKLFDSNTTIFKIKP